MATDLHLAENGVQLTNIFPWVWKETAVADGLGEYYASSLWSQPMHTIFGLLAFANITFEIQTKLFGLIILLLGFWGIWKLLDKFHINNVGKGIGSIFFLLNSFFLLLFDGGQLSLAFAYSILPIVFAYFLSSEKVKFAFWVLILSIADIRIVYLELLIILLYLFFDNKTFLKRNLIMGIFAGVIFIGFHMYWLLPVLLSKPLQLPQTYERVSQVNFLSFSSLGHSLLLQSPHWPQNVFGRLANLKSEFIFIPFLVFSAFSLVKRNKAVAFWSSVALVSIFLSKGSNEPFGQIYAFLFKNMPGFSLFRDPTKFYFLIGLSYSILIAFSSQALSKTRFLPVLIILYFVFLARPLFLGQMTGLFSFPHFQKEFEQLANNLQNDPNFSRIFWVPTSAPLSYVSMTHPAVPADRLSQKRPFAIGNKGTYEKFNFLREASYMGQTFDVAGIGYIAYPNLDPRRDDMHPDNIKYYYTFLGQLSERAWLNRIEDSSVPLFKTREHQDRFFIAPNTWWVIGSDSIYNEATKSANLTLSQNALIFAEEYPGLGKKIDELPEVKIVLNGKTNLDLAASFIDPLNLIFPAKNLDFQPDKSGWWKREAADLVWWRSFLQEKYGIDNQDFDLGGGWAVGEKDVRLKVKSEKIKKDKILLARVMESSRSGELKFYQKKNLLGWISTNICKARPCEAEETNARWFEVGKLNSNRELEIASEGDINVVNALAILDEKEWLKYKQVAEEFKDQGRIVRFDEKGIESSGASVTYRKINPTRYKVLISGLKKTAFLVFSQNFDGLWKINNQYSLPVYSLLNGFRVDGDGEYIVEFEPQEYVYPGLIVSGLTLAVLVILLLI